jgi:hypothetical protein
MPRLIKLEKLLIQIVVFSLPFLIPVFEANFNPSEILTPTTFIFSVLAGFFISDATSNYRSLKELITSENATLCSMYYKSKQKSISYSKKVGDAIDRYMIAQLDYDLLAHVDGTRNEFREVIDVSAESSELDSERANLIKSSQEVLVSTQKSVTKLHWTIIIMLAFTIGTLLLLKRNGDILLSVIIGLVLVSIYQVLRLLSDLDSNRYLASKLSFKTPQYVFMAIERLPYYPERAISNKWVHPKKPYRVGIYKNYPDSFDKDIKIIK